MVILLESWFFKSIFDWFWNFCFPAICIDLRMRSDLFSAFWILSLMDFSTTTACSFIFPSALLKQGKRIWKELLYFYWLKVFSPGWRWCLLRWWWSQRWRQGSRPTRCQANLARPLSSRHSPDAMSTIWWRSKFSTNILILCHQYHSHKHCRYNLLLHLFYHFSSPSSSS